MTSWRDVIRIHPATELFPLMTETELRELGEDIRKNGHSVVHRAMERRQGRNARKPGASSVMTLWRWDRDPTLNFPPRISIRDETSVAGRDEQFKKRLLRRAIAQRLRELRG
jgi:hypothetical protein